MDFHSLSRRELQSLCKRNGIQANTTNLAMAAALASLRRVEGLDHQPPFLSPKKAPPFPQGSPLPGSRRVAARPPGVLSDELGEDEKGAPPETPPPPRAPVTARKGAATGTSARVSKKKEAGAAAAAAAEEERTVGPTTRRRATRQSSTTTTADVAAYGSISTRRRRSARGRAAAANKMADLTSKEEEENDFAENVTTSNDQAIGEEKDLLSPEESKEDQKVTVTEIVSSNQDNVTEQEHQEEKDANEDVQVEEEEAIVEMAKADQNEEECQVAMPAADDLLLGLERISISVEPKEGGDTISSAVLVQDESLGSGNDNKEDTDRVAITTTLTKAELGSVSLRKLKAMYKDIKIKEAGEEKRFALKALDENCV